MASIRNILAVLYKGLWQSTYKGDRWIKYAIRILSIILFLCIFHKFIANDVPIIAKTQNEVVFPVLQDYAQSMTWKSTEQIRQKEVYQWAIYPIIPYRDKTLDEKNTGSISPFSPQEVSSWRYRHWLGTDQLGRDVLAGLIYGLATAMKVGFYSGLIALILGLFLGGVAGYFGDYSLKWNGVGMFFTFLLIFLCWYLLNYSILFNSLVKGFILWIGLIILSWLIIRWSQKLNLKKFKIPMDLIIVRFMEVFKSIPVLIFLIAILGLMKSASIWNVILLIGLIRWPTIARYVRAEMLAVKKQDYIRSAKALGANNLRILWKHALPNILSPILVSVAFGFAVAILLESSLSFLGIGVPLDQVTLGSMLSEARKDFSAWWLAVFPGLMIFILLACFNMLGQRVEEYYNPKLKQ